MNTLVPKEDFKKLLIEIIDKASTMDTRVRKFKDLLLDPNNYGDNYHTSPKKMTFDIRSTGETAYQRAILNANPTLLDFKKNNGFEKTIWMDGELPIVLNRNPRRPSIDLIGSLDGVPAICELKFAKKKASDSPVYAVIELLTYYCLIQFNADYLDKYQVNHKNMIPFKWNVITNNGYPSLIVCANKSYWDSWLTKLDTTTLKTLVLSWGTSLLTNISLFQTEDFDFESQKGTETYIPAIPTNTIWEIIK
jgi:hypothetical protein